MVLSPRPITIYPITVRQLRVLRVTDVTPGMRRVTLGGPGLDAHAASNGMPVNAFRSDGFDDEFKLFFTHPERSEPLYPEQGDGHVIWPRDAQLVSRTYTVRRWDPRAGEVDVDFVVHGLGAATTWARRAKPGDILPVAGPKASAPHPVGVDWTLVAGDETALPVIGRWLEDWPEGARGQIFVEIAEDGHRQNLPVPDGVELTWLSRHGAPPGTTSLLFDAIRSAAWWEGDVFAWVAGEATTLVPIRRWLRGERCLQREQVEVTGYWRLSTLSASENDPEIPDDVSAGGHTEPLHELAEIVPGLVLRIAVTLDVPEVLADGALTAPMLAQKLCLDSTGIALLLEYLAELDIVQRVGVSNPMLEEAYELTTLGVELLDDYTAEQLDLRLDSAARELTGALMLLSAMVAHRRPDLGKIGQLQHLETKDVVASRLTNASEICGYIGPTLVEALPLAAYGRITVISDAAGPLTQLLTATNSDVEVAILAPPTELKIARTMMGDLSRVSFVPGTLMSAPGQASADASLLAGVLPSFNDADACQVLAEASRIATQVYIFEAVIDPEDVDEHDLEHRLINFGLGAGGERTESQIRSLCKSAGLKEQSRELIGWGGILYRFTRDDKPNPA